MTTVKQLLDAKGHDVHCVHPDDSVLDALRVLETKNVGSVLVTDGGKLVGIFTERHYARNVFLKGRSSPETPIRDVMEREVVCVAPEKTVDACMALMTEKHIRHLPVLRDEELVGVISIGDLVKSIIADREFTIEQLEHFIRG
jgi:CBS domain-containing protein